VEIRPAAIPAPSDSRLANDTARAILRGFEEHQRRFRDITLRTRPRFEARDTAGMRRDAIERLDLYKVVTDGVVDEVRALLGERAGRDLLWAGAKAVYSGLITGRDDWDLAETFFNSITRRIFATVGVNRAIEFVDTDFDTPPTRSGRPIVRGYAAPVSTVALLEAVLNDCDLAARWEDPARDVRLAAADLDARLRGLGWNGTVDRAEIVEPIFYRGDGAYLVGRVFAGTHVFPLVLALLHGPGGIAVDALLLREGDVSILFSFAHSYFHVDCERPYDLVQFLRRLLPKKRVTELYTSIGAAKHGKTERYRELLHHLDQSDDLFEIARGDRGMVMIVFTMPSYEDVFKVIRDEFDEPKRTTGPEIMAKYRLVFRHDRAGRLIDAQEFEHLRFDRRRFAPDLLEELTRRAARRVTVDGDSVVIRHLYIERRLTPLNLFLKSAGPEAGRAAVVDYGKAIKDLASANIFPGDILLKNFGVSRHGRVIFYDYDELCLLTDCAFRDLPAARTDDEEYAAEPQYVVGENDIFPAEFHSFLGLAGDLREAFTRAHTDLFEAASWRAIQERVRAGDLIRIAPYHESRRLRRPRAGEEGTAVAGSDASAGTSTPDRTP
jgi:isocitrate dehydrogenase kinase/phosphatase